MESPIPVESFSRLSTPREYNLRNPNLQRICFYNMATVCETCGDQGFVEALAYCDSCKTAAAVHRYCLGITPVPIEGYITWFCDACDGSDSGSDRETLAQIFNTKKKKKKKHTPLVSVVEDQGDSTVETAIRKGAFVSEASEKPQSISSHFDKEAGSLKSRTPLGASNDHPNIPHTIESVGKSSCKVAESNMPQRSGRLTAEPISTPVWRGSISVKEGIIRSIDGLVAHLSSLACPQVRATASSLHILLSAEMFPRLEIWPKSFLKNGGPKDENIALYFFPSSDSNENGSEFEEGGVLDLQHVADGKVFDSFLLEMRKNDFGMKCILENAELLLFTSYVLPLHCWSFRSKEYLWGVFRPKQKRRHMSRTNHYAALVDEEGHELPTGGASASGSGTVDQPGGSQRRGSGPRGRRTPGAPDQPSPPPPQDYALIERINMILRTPGRKAKKLDPDRPDGTYWFGVDSYVGKTVSDAIKKHFPRGYYNWSQATDQAIRDQWFELWTQMYWTWDEALTYRVRREFEMKACKRLGDIVSRWKEDWLKMRDLAMPVGMDPAAWKGLVDYWRSQKGQDHAKSASKSRNTPVGPGDVPSRHRLGRRPIAGLRLKMAQESETGELPPVIDVYERAYRKADGSFVTKAAEKVYTEYELAVTQARESQADSSATPMTTQDYDDIFKKVAPKKKGRTLGLGSIDDVPACSSSSQHHSASRQAAIDAELAEHRRFREETLARERGFLDMLQMMAGDNPIYLQAINNLTPRSTPIQPPTEAQVSDREATLRSEAGIPDVQLGNQNTF